MKKLFFYLILLNTFNSFGQNQNELNSNANKQYKSSDSTLNSVYKQILKVYSTDATFIKNIKTAQNLWIKFRDAELKVKVPENYSNGSVQPMCTSLYLTDMTNDRIRTLRIWLDGIEEGNVCSGSMRRKE